MNLLNTIRGMQQLDEAVDAKKVVAHLIKKGNNPKEAEEMVKKEFDGAIKAYPKASVSKVAEYIRSVAEETELEEKRKYTPPTEAEKKKDKDREAGKGDRMYGKMRGGLKKEEDEDEDAELEDEKVCKGCGEELDDCECEEKDEVEEGLKAYDKTKDIRTVNTLSHKAKTKKLTSAEKSKMDKARRRLINHGAIKEDAELDEAFDALMEEPETFEVEVGSMFGGATHSKSMLDAINAIATGESAELQEAKLDKVDKKALKKDFDDRKDQDIDNDGDVDDSDEYLHKKRKAVSKAIDKDEAGEDEPKEKEQKVGKSGKQTKVDVNPQLDEELTPEQEKKREEIVMSMKDKMPEFKKKYGDRAKDVMYATATKLAKKQA